MKKTGFFRQLLCCFLALVLMLTPVYAAETNSDISIEQGCRTIDAQQAFHSGAEELAQTYSALLYDVTNDVLIYADNPDQQYYPAGLVKIMTALIVAERADLAEQVTVKQEVLDSIAYGSKGMEFQAGEVIPMQELLYCMLVEGANIAASLAADHLCGSQEAFVQEMNDYAAQLGCTNTNFVNVHGLHDELQVTTARDIAKIVNAAIKNDVFSEVFSTYARRIPATNMSEERKISSSNYLLNRNLGSNHFEKRATGSRMGVTVGGEVNLVVTAEVDNVELISIVLGSASEINPNGEEGCYKEARILLDKGFNEHNSVQILHDHQVLEQFEVQNGDCDVTTCVKVSSVTSLPVGVDDADLSYRYTQQNAVIQAPVRKDDTIGTVQVWYQNVCLAQAELFALHDVGIQEAVAIDDISDEQEVSAFTVLTVVVVIVGLLVMLLVGRRLIFRIIRSRQLRRHRKNRRRSH